MKNLLITFVCVFLVSGCASVVNVAKGGMQKIYFTTPTGKSVIAVIDGQRISIPAVVEVKKSKDIIINVFESDNPQYQNYSARLSSLSDKERVPAWWLNIGASYFSTSASATDSLTGNTYQYTEPVVILPVNEK